MTSRFILSALLALSLPAVAHADGDATKGAQVFKKCMACHMPDTATNKVGPHLGDVEGRKAASVEGYAYSEAMKAKGAEGLVWDDANLDQYLADPKGFVPKNKMIFPGLKKPEDRANVIAYLKSLKGS